ncbi:MAG: hypothetical protein AAFW00_23630 [Bacteroidota bacterium]
MKKIFSLIIIILMLASCRLNPLEDLNWETDVMAPIAFGEVNIWDAISDTSFFDTDNNNLISIVYRDTVASLRVSDFVDIPDTSTRYVVTLDTLSLSSDTIEEIITLRQFAEQLEDNPDPQVALIGTFLLANPVGFFPVFSPISFSGIASDTISIDATDFFESAVLEAGELVIIIDNQFPIDLDSVELSLFNINIPGPDLVNDLFPKIASRTSETRTYDLAGKELGSDLGGQLSNLSINIDQGFVYDIDQDFLSIKLIAQDLKPTTATAIFPAQTIVDTLQSRDYSSTGEFAELSLTKIVLRSGKIRAEAESTVEDSILFAYSLPDASNSLGQVPIVNIKLDPAMQGMPSRKVEEFDLSGYTLNLTGDGTQVNTLQERLLVQLLESGNLVTLDQTDSVAVDFSLVDLDPVYIEGYVGQQTFSYTGNEVFDVFSDLDVKRIRFSQAKGEISIGSSVGLEGALEVNDFTAINNETGEKVRLSGTPLVAGPVIVGGPRLPDTNATVFTNIPLTPDNSNINSFVSILADEINYDVELKTNFRSSIGQLDNFVTDKSEINLYLDFELPLEGLMEELVLMDTVALDASTIDIEEVSEGTLRLVFENQFPVEVRVTAKVLDEQNQTLDVLAESFILNPGIPGSGGYVSDLVQSVLDKSYTVDALNDILAEGAFISLQFTFDTRPQDEYVQFYSDYRIKAKLVGQFIYGLSN